MMGLDWLSHCKQFSTTADYVAGTHLKWKCNVTNSYLTVSAAIEAQV